MNETVALVGRDPASAGERARVRAWLEGEGYAVGAFEDPGAALTFIRDAQPPAVVVTEKQWPDANGDRFVYEVRQVARDAAVFLVGPGETIGDELTYWLNLGPGRDFYSLMDLGYGGDVWLSRPVCREPLVGMLNQMAAARAREVKPERAALRAQVLAALACRGSLEAGAGSGEARTIHRRVLAWMTDADLWVEADPGETALLRAPLGRLDPEDAARATWRAEGLALLAWALKRTDALPPHDAKADPYAAAEAVGFLSDDARALREGAELRHPNELHACREFLYAVHARLRDYRRAPGRRRFDRWLYPSYAVELGYDIRRVLAKNDLLLGGRPLADADPETLDTCEQITEERHRAILWLNGEHPVYAEVRVDT